MEDASESKSYLGARPFGLPIKQPPSSSKRTPPTFYQFLVENEHAQFQRKALLTSEDFHPNSNLIVRFETPTIPASWDTTRTLDREKPNMYFFIFESYLYFYAWMKSIDRRYRTFHEILTANTSRKPYFDIDFPITVEFSVERQEEIETQIQLFAGYACAVSGLSKACSMVFSSHTPSKFSFHIVILNVILRNYVDSGIYQRATVQLAKAQKIPEWLLSTLDLGVYKSVQSLRILGSFKYRANATADKTGKKVFREDLSTAGFSDDVPQRKLFIFSESLLTHVSGCSFPTPESDFCQLREQEKIEFLRKKEAEREARQKYLEENGLSEEIYQEATADEIERCFLLLKKYHLERSFRVEFPFELRMDAVSFDEERGGTLIPLTRIAPSECLICFEKLGKQRIHEKEHPYISVRPGVNVSMFCRRSGEEDPITGFPTGKDAKITLFFGEAKKRPPPPARIDLFPPPPSRVETVSIETALAVLPKTQPNLLTSKTMSEIASKISRDRTQATLERIQKSLQKPKVVKKTVRILPLKNSQF